MTGIVEIRCPNCASVGAVKKMAVGSYRCEDCDHEFGPEDVRPD